MTEIVFIEEQPTAGREHRLASDASIGRWECDVVLDDPEVSRRHAQLRPSGSGVAVEDLGSTHGTYVNGRPISGVHELSPGDRVSFGATVWRLEPIEAEPVAAPTTPASAAPAPAAPVARAAPQAAGGVAREAFHHPPGRLGRSAARRLEATAVSYGVVGATAVALVVYFAQR